MSVAFLCACTGHILTCVHVCWCMLVARVCVCVCVPVCVYSVCVRCVREIEGGKGACVVFVVYRDPGCVYARARSPIKDCLSLVR